MLIGYARVSTDDQDTVAQVAALTAAGCERIFHEKASGGRWNRPHLQVIHRRVEQLVLHEQLADLGVQPLVLLIPGIRRPALQAGLARGQKLIPPLRGPRRRDPQLPRHGLEILSAQQTQHRLALAPG